MKRNSSPFKWRHFEPELILLCVRWYCRYQLSYRDLEEMMRERGLNVDHSTIFRSRTKIRSRNQQANPSSFKTRWRILSS
jgi:transposase-like protein